MTYWELSVLRLQPHLSIFLIRKSAYSIAIPPPSDYSTATTRDHCVVGWCWPPASYHQNVAYAAMVCWRFTLICLYFIFLLLPSFSSRVHFSDSKRFALRASHTTTTTQYTGADESTAWAPPNDDNVAGGQKPRRSSLRSSVVLHGSPLYTNGFISRVPPLVPFSSSFQ